MKYFIDTEFIEGFHKPLFGKKRHFIDLISIGIVAEDGRTYYAISNEFNAKQADIWVYDNVIDPLLIDWIKSYRTPNDKMGNKNLDSIRGKGKYGSIKIMQKDIGKSNKQIAEEIFRFIHYPTYKKWDDKFSFIEEIVDVAYKNGEQDHEFYAYYADYDWVLFCSLFGRMIDLPKGFPMYCKDLKQLLDSKIDDYFNYQPDEQTVKQLIDSYNQTGTFIHSKPNMSWDELLNLVKNSDSYPKQENEHNALADAKWNFELYKFLQTI